jgi:hypothetical protein
MRQQGLALRLGFKRVDPGDSVSTSSILIRATDLLVSSDFELEPAHARLVGRSRPSREQVFMTSRNV